MNLSSIAKNFISLEREQNKIWLLDSIYGDGSDLLNFSEKDVDLGKIVRCLPKINRFNGDFPIPYSVGHHSLFCFTLGNWNIKENLDFADACLIHDFGEAFIGDIVQPVKKLEITSFIKEIEKQIDNSIYSYFKINVNEELHKSVKLVDQAALYCEALLYLHLEKKSTSSLPYIWQQTMQKIYDSESRKFITQDAFDFIIYLSSFDWTDVETLLKDQINRMLNKNVSNNSFNYIKYI